MLSEWLINPEAVLEEMSYFSFKGFGNRRLDVFVEVIRVTIKNRPVNRIALQLEVRFYFLEIFLRDALESAQRYLASQAGTGDTAANN